MPSIRWLLPQNKSLPFPLRRKKDAVLTCMGRSRFCVSSPLLTLRPLIKISFLSVRERSLYIIGIPLTRCGNSSLLPFLNASSFSSSDEILAIKRGDLHLFLVSRFFFFCGRISLFPLSGRRNLLVEVKILYEKF